MPVFTVVTSIDQNLKLEKKIFKAPWEMFGNTKIFGVTQVIMNYLGIIIGCVAYVLIVWLAIYCYTNVSSWKFKIMNIRVQVETWGKKVKLAS